MQHLRLSPKLCALVLSVSILVACARTESCPGISNGSLCLEVSRFAVAFGPRTLVYADLDGDGAGDLIAANHEPGTFSVLWGSDTEMGAETTLLPVASQISGVVVADFNDDGYLDLATALPAEDKIGVHLGGGGRSFPKLQHHAVGAAPRSIVAANLDAAGPPELVTGNVGDGSISILRGLTDVTHVAVGPGPSGLATGDLDGDDDVDLVVALPEADALQLLLNDGHGRLSLGPRHLVEGAPQAVVVADFDVDGALDLASLSEFEEAVSVFHGDNKGNLRAQETWACIPQASDLVVVNSEGGPPALGVLSVATSTVQRLDPLNGETLAGATTSWASAIVSGAGGFLHYASAMNNRIGRLEPGTGLQLTTLWQGPAMTRGWAVDLDDDGIDELILSEKLAGPLKLWRGGPGLPVELDTGLAAVWSVDAGEVTGDASREIVVWDRRQVAVLQRDGVDLYSPGPPMTVGERITDVALGDGDGDGRLDLLVLAERETASQLYWFASDPNGALQLGGEVPLGFDAISLDAVAGAGDLRADLMISDGEGRVHYLQDVTAPPRELAFAEGHSIQAAAYADLEGDGDLDVVTCGPQGLRAFRNVLEQEPADFEILSDIACSGLHLDDLDADGFFDVVGRTDVAIQPVQVRSLLTPWLQGDQGWTALGSHSVGYASSFSFAQMDDDGISDLVIIQKERPTEARRVVLGPALVAANVVAIDTPRRFRVGDVDGDGAADLVGIGAKLSLALADGRGSFGPLHQPIVTGSLAEVPISDVVLVESSGEADEAIIVATDEAPGSQIYIVTFAEGVANAQHLASLPASGIQLYSHDLDDDGVVDLAALSTNPESEVHVFLGLAEGGVEPPRTTLLAAPAPVARPRFYDLDGDGQIDLVGASAAGVLWLRGRGRGVFEPVEVYSPVLADDLLPADLDADGLTELVLLRQQTLSVLRGAEESGPLLADVSNVAIADLDADGQPELLATTGPGRLSGPIVALLVGRHMASAMPQFSEYILPSRFVQAIHLADVDGDANFDIILTDDVGVTVMKQVP
ncbi:VCBS repeat-containing protein [Nannocystis sp. bb15-2]|uniref:VCBS repeat-containing protein n=2 Tax=Nannocystis bainbridge TaxID=2995303 RepID=A0ABT5E8M9_9BACT|nr:VCBS repeat-containing protein [Nannocystis bainbridge]